MNIDIPEMKPISSSRNNPSETDKPIINLKKIATKLIAQVYFDSYVSNVII